MVRRGLVASRSEAALAIRSGRVVVSGSPAMKAGSLVLSDEPISLRGAPRPYVSRGGEKLESALDRFAIDASGALALDAGASTGGFTHCLLSRGARHVIAVDVGYGQLDWRLRQDPRVTVLERTNVRNLRAADLPFAPEIVVADLSFISLTIVIPPLAELSAPDSDFVLLVKPQFEAGRDNVGSGGVVVDPKTWRSALLAVVEASRRAGLQPSRVMASPLRGPAGNVEFLLHATRGPGGGEASPDVDQAIADGLALRTGPAPVTAPRTESDGGDG